MLTVRKTRSPAAAALLASLAAAAMPRRRRSLRAFAEAEFKHPTGEFAGCYFRADRQPFTRLWLDEVDSGKWTYIFTTGPSQSGKTALASVLPVLYHLFEVGETVVFGLPDMAMAADKWAIDLKPAIEAGRFRELLPVRGDGSRDGKAVDLIRFGNGAALKFMGCGGGDKQRAHFTARVLVATEIDAMDVTTGDSPEGSKFEQLKARVRGFREGVRRVYGECTLTTTKGLTFREIATGSASRIACPCVHCGAWVTPEREHLVGWQGAESVVAARAQAAYVCPACGVLLTEADRRVMNVRAVLVHRWQAVSGPFDRPVVESPPPPSDTLGFRWNAWNNFLLAAADVAADEWRGQQNPDDLSVERMMRQFVWALPITPGEDESAELGWDQVAGRGRAEWPRGVVPAEAETLTAFLDLGKWTCHWTLVAMLPDGSPHVVDYNLIETEWDRIGEERALLVAMAAFRDLCEAGWPTSAGGDVRRRPRIAAVDSGNWTTWAYAFIRAPETAASSVAWYPAKGHGMSLPARGGFPAPQKDCVDVGPGYNSRYQPAHGVLLLHVDADHWKTWVRQRCTTPVGQPGALSLCAGRTADHRDFGQQLVAEYSHLEWDAKGKAMRTGWLNKRRRKNHWLDALAGAGALAHLAGARLPGEEPAAPAANTTPRRRGGVRLRRY